MIGALYFEFFKIGLFSVGGGYSSFALIQHRLVEELGWLTPAEFTDVLTISQMTPGPIAINAATFTGVKTAGLLGGLAATAGYITAPACVVSILAHMYFKYKKMDIMQGVMSLLRPAVLGLIFSAAVSVTTLVFWGGRQISLAALDVKSVIIFAIALFALSVKIRGKKISPVWVVAVSGAAGFLAALLK
ncbi:MAG: chromate transporter [Clostridiales bacterium]|jgi:chromate transporter|nr:chromate transporter [Clostridiales bacterium]